MDYETTCGILALIITGLILFAYNSKSKMEQFITLEIAVIAMVVLTSNIKGINYSSVNIKYFIMFFALYSSHVVMLFAGLKLKKTDPESLFGSYLLSASISGAIISVGWNLTDFPLHQKNLILAASLWSALTAIFCIFISRRIAAIFTGFILLSAPVYAYLYNNGNIKDSGDIVVVAVALFLIMIVCVSFISRIIHGPLELSEREQRAKDKESRRAEDAFASQKAQQERVEIREKERRRIRARHGIHEWDTSQDSSIDFGHYSKYLD